MIKLPTTIRSFGGTNIAQLVSLGFLGLCTIGCSSLKEHGKEIAVHCLEPKYIGTTQTTHELWRTLDIAPTALDQYRYVMPHGKDTIHLPGSHLSKLTCDTIARIMTCADASKVKVIIDSLQAQGIQAHSLIYNPSITGRMLFGYQGHGVNYFPLGNLYYSLDITKGSFYEYKPFSDSIVYSPNYLKPHINGNNGLDQTIAPSSDLQQVRNLIYALEKNTDMLILNETNYISYLGELQILNHNIIPTTSKTNYKQYGTITNFPVYIIPRKSEGGYFQKSSASKELALTSCKDRQELIGEIISYLESLEQEFNNKMEKINELQKQCISALTIDTTNLLNEYLIITQLIQRLKGMEQVYCNTSTNEEAESSEDCFGYNPQLGTIVNICGYDIQSIDIYNMYGTYTTRNSKNLDIRTGLTPGTYKAIITFTTNEGITKEEILSFIVTQ